MLAGGFVTAFVPLNAPLEGPSDGCAAFFLVLLRVTERTGPGLTVRVNETMGEARPLSEFSAILSLGGSSVAELRPLAVGASKGALTFHDVTRPGDLSEGDNFTVSPLSPGAYRLDLICLGELIGRETWTA